MVTLPAEVSGAVSSEHPGVPPMLIERGRHSLCFSMAAMAERSVGSDSIYSLMDMKPRLSKSDHKQYYIPPKGSPFYYF